MPRRNGTIAATVTQEMKEPFRDIQKRIEQQIIENRLATESSEESKKDMQEQLRKIDNTTLEMKEMFEMQLETIT